MEKEPRPLIREQIKAYQKGKLLALLDKFPEDDRRWELLYALLEVMQDRISTALSINDKLFDRVAYLEYAIAELAGEVQCLKRPDKGSSCHNENAPGPTPSSPSKSSMIWRSRRLRKSYASVLPRVRRARKAFRSPTPCARRTRKWPPASSTWSAPTNHSRSSALPPGMRETALAVSLVRNVDPAMVASPALAAAASLIGTTHRITPNMDWYEDCALWPLVICDSGTRKTPAFNAALAFIMDEQGRLSTEYNAALETDKEAVRQWQEAEKGTRGPRPRPTAVDRCIVTTDATIEGLGRCLAGNPRGILYASEEADAIFKGLTRYNSDSTANYLQLYTAGLISKRRADPEKPSIIVVRALASLCGTIQPGVFQSLITALAVASGLLVRFPPVLARSSSEHLPAEPGDSARVGRLGPSPARLIPPSWCVRSRPARSDALAGGRRSVRGMEQRVGTQGLQCTRRG